MKKTFLSKICIAIVMLIWVMLLPHGVSAQTSGDESETINAGLTRVSHKYKLFRGRADYQLISFELADDLKSVSPQFMKKNGKVSKRKVINLLFYQVDPDTLFDNNSAGGKTITLYGRKITRTERNALEKIYGKEIMKRLRHDGYLMATGYKIVGGNSTSSTTNGGKIQEEDIKKKK